MRADGEPPPLSAPAPAPKVHVPPFLFDYPKDKINPMIQQIFLQLQQLVVKNPAPTATVSSEPPPPKPNPTPKIPRSATPPPAAVKKSKKKIRPVSLPVKRIITPDWIDAAPSTPAFPAPLAGAGFDLVSSHKRIELFESRIQSGIDTRYKHPALAREAANTSETPIPTKDELAKRDRYQEVNIPAIVPRFWPPRPWDSNVLADDATETLRAEIAEFNRLPVFNRVDGFPQSPFKLKRSMSVSPKRNRPDPVVALPVSSFVTDDDDDTDWGDF
jgi:hypothetical protein